MHKVTLLLGVLGIILFVSNELFSRSKMQQQGFEVISTLMFIIKLVFISVIIGGIAWVLAGYRGLSWTAVVILVVVFIYHFITTKTVLGRHIYAVGGNPEAAELSGISVKKITHVVFASMGILSALSGILYASRLRSATTIGALIMISLTSGMNLMQIDISYQYIVRALVLAAAVIFDVTTRRRSKT